MDIQKMNPFYDLFCIMSSLFGVELGSKSGEIQVLQQYSRTFQSFYKEFKDLTLSKVDFKAWNKLNNHRILRIKFKRLLLKSMYEQILKQDGSLTEILHPSYSNFKHHSPQEGQSQLGMLSNK